VDVIVEAEAGADSVWTSSKKTSHVKVLDADTAVDEAVYVLCNPVEAGLVHEGRLWPGHRSSPRAAASGPQVIKRPNFRYFKGDTWPDQVALTYGVPPSHAHLTPEDGDSLVGPSGRERMSCGSSLREPEPN